MFLIKRIRGDREEESTYTYIRSKQADGKHKEEERRERSNTQKERTMANRPFLSSLSCIFFRLCSSLAKLRGSNLKSPGCEVGREGGREERMSGWWWTRLSGK